MVTQKISVRKGSVRALSNFLLDNGYVISVVQEDYSHALGYEDRVAITYEVPHEYSEDELEDIFLKFADVQGAR